LVELDVTSELDAVKESEVASVLVVTARLELSARVSLEVDNGVDAEFDDMKDGKLIPSQPVRMSVINAIKGKIFFGNVCIAIIIFQA
jgi:hypothetical protein